MGTAILSSMETPIPDWMIKNGLAENAKSWPKWALATAERVGSGQTVHSFACQVSSLCKSV